MTTDNPRYQLFPVLTENEFQSLKNDIAKHGILVPVEKDESGNILDGHHRIRAWEELRAEGVNVPDYPRLIRAGLNEDEKLNHIRSLNLLRRHLTSDQQKPHWVEMRKAGMTYQAIADKSGVSKPVVIDALSESKNLLSEIANTRGQKRPSKYKPRQPKTVMALNSKDDEIATEAIRQAGDDLPDKTITTKRAARIGRESEAENRRNELKESLSNNPEINKNGHYDLRHGRFQIVLSDIERDSVDLFCTDPPYGKQYLSEWDDLADCAERLLKPGGYLVTYSGQMYLPEVMKSLSSKLRYVWVIAQINGSSKKNSVTNTKVYSQWKPILIYCKEPFSPTTEWINDIIKGVEMEKDFHEWQQGLSEAEFIINNYSKPGDTVIDPFLGSGTTVLACLKLNRQIIGCDIDAACISRSVERIHE